MDIKHLQFSFRMYWANMKGLLNMVAEGIILVASLASLFILVYQFGFKYSAHVTHMLETSRRFRLLYVIFQQTNLTVFVQHLRSTEPDAVHINVYGALDTPSPTLAHAAPVLE